MPTTVPGKQTVANASLTPAARPEIVAHDGGAQPVEIGYHDTALDPSRNLVDEARKTGVAPQPENRDLRAQPGHLVEPPHGVGDGPRMRWVVEENRRALAVEILEMCGRLAVSDDEYDGLRVGVGS